MARQLFATTGTTGIKQSENFGKASTVQVYGSTSSGVGSATVQIEVSNDPTAPFIVLGTITLTLGTSATADGFAVDADWEIIRANVTALTGTGATVTGIMGA